MQNIIQALVAVVAFWLIYAYLLPLLPDPLRAIVLVLLVLAALVSLLRLVA